MIAFAKDEGIKKEIDRKKSFLVKNQIVFVSLKDKADAVAEELSLLPKEKLYVTI